MLSDTGRKYIQQLLVIKDDAHGKELISNTPRSEALLLLLDAKVIYELIEGRFAPRESLSIEDNKAFLLLFLEARETIVFLIEKFFTINFNNYAIDKEIYQRLFNIHMLMDRLLSKFKGFENLNLKLKVPANAKYF